MRFYTAVCDVTNGNIMENGTRQAKYVYRNMEARSYNHCCSGEAMSFLHQSVCICSFRYPACNDHAPYFHLWPVWLYHIFLHYHINCKIFVKKRVKLNTKLIFSTPLSKTFLILRRNKRDIIKKCVVVFT